MRLYAVTHRPLVPGWLVPAALIAWFIAAPLPAHVASVRAPWLLAAGGAVFLLAASLIAARLAREVVLRWPGASGPRGVSSRGRLIAHAAGAFTSAAIAGAALGLQSGSAPATFAHAIGSMAFAVNAGLVVLSTAPISGFGGWTMLLMLVDLGSPGPRDRVRMVAVRARVAAVATGIAGLAIARVTAEPMTAAVGVGPGAIIWVQAGAAVAADAAERYFAGRLAKDLARPLTAVRGPDFRLVDLDTRSRGEVALVVSPSGELLGAFGPRQVLVASRRWGADASCADAMAPVGVLRFVPGTGPATLLIPVLAEFGFAVVRSDSGIAVVEAADVQHQMRVWTLIGEWGRRRHLGGDT